MENEDLLEKIKTEKNKSFVLNIEERKYPIHELSITRSKIPVRKPTTRGGVYFTDIEAFKIKASVDLSVGKEITSLMLGPNTEFKSVLIEATLKIEERNQLIILKTHLTNSTSTKEKIELNLIVDKIDLK